MAKFTFADGTVFEGTVEELAEYARLAGGAEAEQSKEIEGPVRVGDTIEITKAATDAVKRGKRYKVARIDDEGYPRVDGYGLSDFGLAISKYRIVERKEEAPQPAKPAVKVGDYVVATDDYFDYVTEGKAYEVVGIDGDGEPLIEDDDGDEIGLEPYEYRIITDARELAFAKAGRKLDEFKAGDIVKVTTGYRDIEKGDIGVVTKPDGSNIPGVTVRGIEWYVFCDLIAPAEARVDGE